MNQGKTNTAQKDKPKGKTKAVILSAAVFPGLGQLSQGKKPLGIFIMVACGLCLFIVLGEAMGEINAAAQRMAQSGSLDIFRAQEESHAIIMNLKTPKFLTALYALIGLWVYSIIEIFEPFKK